MAYDLLIKNGRIIDGSGMPAFRGDVAVRAGKIVELGKLSGAATRVIDADGLGVAPGVVDNHCHYDAQVTWDPLCSFSCYRAATPEEIEAMRGIVRDGMQAGALGLSVSRNRGHFDPQGTLIPALWAEEEEIFALGNVLRDLGTGLIQSGGGRDAELKNRLMSRLSEATGRAVMHNTLGQTA